MAFGLVEDADRLDVRLPFRVIRRRGDLEGSTTVSVARGSHVRVTASFVDDVMEIESPPRAPRHRQRLDIEPTFSPLVGERWWATCPECGRRVAVLYRPRWSPAFACSACHRLAYGTASGAPEFRALYRLRRLRSAINPEHPLGNPPERPKGMHTRTYDRLVAKFYEAERELEAAEWRSMERIGKGHFRAWAAQRGLVDPRCR